MRSALYVDGFNLYNGCLRQRPELKWLDLVKLAERLVPTDRISHVRYFTAPIRARDDEPQAPARQRLYWRALETRAPVLTIHQGKFSTRRKLMPMTRPAVGSVGVEGLPNLLASVNKTEEKGSDVNLASLLLHDAFTDEYDRALVVTNDTDLVLPITLVRDELRREVLVFNPHLEQFSSQLSKAASAYRPLELAAIEASQFPDELDLASGRRIRRPVEWTTPAETSAGSVTVSVPQRKR